MYIVCTRVFVFVLFNILWVVVVQTINPNTHMFIHACAQLDKQTLPITERNIKFAIQRM